MKDLELWIVQKKCLGKFCQKNKKKKEKEKKMEMLNQPLGFSTSTTNLEAHLTHSIIVG